MRNRTRDRLLFNIIAYLFIGFFALVCIIPFIMVIASSFAKESDILKNGFSLFPAHLTLFAYKVAFTNPLIILRAYGITVFVTITGTIIGVYLMAMTAYVIHKRTFRIANGLAFYFFFTTLFNAGLVPWYIMMIK